MNKFPKQTINLLIILITLAAAVYYLNKHSYLLTDLRHINPLTGLIVLGLYLIMLMVMVLIFKATLHLANFKLSLIENVLLNCYSTFINFFVPGQVGAAYRAYYLKKNHKLKVVDYTLITLTYYLIYGLLSIELMVIGSQSWWVSLSSLILLVLLAVVASKMYRAKYKKARIKFHLSHIGLLTLATVLQAIVQVVIYWVELHSVNHSIRLNQTITYTGAADLALFVALTPAAIGIRESFLILSEKLHHVSTANIILANVIDRSVFIVFLLILGLVVLYIKFNKHIRKFNLSFKPNDLTMDSGEK